MTEWKAKAKRKLTERSIDLCSKVADQQAQDPDARQKVLSDCLTALTEGRLIEIHEECGRMTENTPTAFEPCLIDKVTALTEATPPPDPCVEGAKFAPDAETAEEFQRWCYELVGVAPKSRLQVVVPTLHPEVPPLHFEAATPTREGQPRVKGVGPFITRKFTLIPLETPQNRLPVPEQFFTLFQVIVNHMIRLGLQDLTLRQGLQVWRGETETALQQLKAEIEPQSKEVTMTEAPEPEEADLEEDLDEEGEAGTPKVGIQKGAQQKIMQKERLLRFLYHYSANIESLFAKEGLVAAKTFHTVIMKSPAFVQFKHRVDKGRFKFLRTTGPLLVVERVWRAAAQFAYFIVRLHRQFQQTLPTILQAIAALPDLPCILEREFPAEETYKTIREAVAKAGLGLTAGQLSPVALGGWCRHVRNSVKRDLTATQGPAIQRTINSTPSPPTLPTDLAQWLTAGLRQERLLKSFLKTISRRLSARLKWVRRDEKQRQRKRMKGLPVRPSAFGKGSLDATLLTILAGRSYMGLPLPEWKELVKQWRDAAYTRLQARLREVQVAEIARRAVAAARKGLTPTRLLTLYRSARPRYVTLADASVADFQQFVEASAISEAERRLSAQLRPQIGPLITTALGTLQTRLQHGKGAAPTFSKPTVPLGIVDTHMYVAPRMTSAGLRGELKLLKEVPIGQKRSRTVTIPFTLHTPARFQAFADQNYIQGQGTLERKGDRLILAIPFQRTAPPQPAEVTLPPQKPLLGASLDLGLKTLVTLHVAPVQRTSEGNWTRTGPEQARYFIDQRYLEGKRDEWIARHADPASYLRPGEAQNHPLRNRKARLRRRKGIPMGFNWKRQLMNLQALVRQRQAALATYKQQAQQQGKPYRHQRVYWRLRREWQQAWQKIHALHEEMASQLATRVIAACQHWRVAVLRMEDLSWSHHASKWKVGYFLTTWQIHWFFSRIQAHISDLAQRIGLWMELVDPRDTSKRCSKCGQVHKANRDRKQFHCHNSECGFRLDADLNAARNILVAPLSHSPVS